MLRELRVQVRSKLKFNQISDGEKVLMLFDEMGWWDGGLGGLILGLERLLEN
jgi:hypothetical protein